ncbi:uncharacterized protein G2W53_013060 [Senna tora]|uniref:Uncharacterized protein n=1 Tax=Senna tora TaxID=362788 RepID=A0A834U027_9FABA|nr:uncharacterized protein G2W53_013060 [Senna tora]
MGSAEAPHNDNNYSDQHQIVYSPSKLSLLISRPSKPPETPPRQTNVSIPFQWEEAPGKPRPIHTKSEPRSDSSNNIARRALELPPRLLFSEAKLSNSSNLPSPTTVLDGPYVGRAMSFTTSYRSPRLVGKEQFGSTRWSSFRKNKEECFEGSFDFSTTSVFDDHAGSASNKAKIARIGRRGSFFSLSQTRTHLWASIYESFKQVVPWKRRQEKQRKWAPRRIDTSHLT